ncbi:unnamed protein product [Polarella glacialis]|uniref:EF-hand domain-containing protein n=1 Tax=Polarella glacialis TaxID=89957 RepID=A0A813KXQ5_POLGL|nr:unnamed protein product [Polarella glacialis]CAE8714568.1 unnamed protein product [Polarella glacialis]
MDSNLPSFGGVSSAESLETGGVQPTTAELFPLSAESAGSSHPPVPVPVEDELFDGLARDEVQSQVEGFLAQLPLSERQEVLERLLQQVRGQRPTTASDQVDESCEFLARLLELESGDSGSWEAVLESVLVRCAILPMDVLLPGGVDTGAAPAPGSDDALGHFAVETQGDALQEQQQKQQQQQQQQHPGEEAPQFLASRRELRLTPSARTPLGSPGKSGKCFSSSAEDTQEQIGTSTTTTTSSFQAVLDAFRAQDASQGGTVEREVLACALQSFSLLADKDVDKLLAAANVSCSGSVRYEDFISWAFR